MGDNLVATLSNGREIDANQRDSTQPLSTSQVVNFPSPAMSPIPHPQLATVPRTGHHPKPSLDGFFSSVPQSILTVPQPTPTATLASSVQSVHAPLDSGGSYVTGAQLLEQRHPAHLQESPYLQVPRPTTVPSRPHPNHPANHFHPQHGPLPPLANGPYVSPRHTSPNPYPVTSIPYLIPQNITPSSAPQYLAPNRHSPPQTVQCTTQQGHAPISHTQNNQQDSQFGPYLALASVPMHTRLQPLPCPRVKRYQSRPHQLPQSQPQPQPQLHAVPTIQPQANDISRPKTPNGTQIMLPATENMAHLCGLQVGTQVDVPRLARWAAYNWDWAIYLQQGGGNDESWWLYRRIAGYPGFAVSGWKEEYEERARKKEEMREKERKAEEAWKAEQARKAIDIRAAENAKRVEMRKGDLMKKEKEGRDNYAAVQMEEKMRKTTKSEIDFTDMMGSFPF